MSETKATPDGSKLTQWMSAVNGSVRSALSLLERNVSVRERAVAAWAKSREPNTRIVDVGAGSCRYAPLFAHCDYVPQDMPDADFPVTSASILRSDITNIPLQSGSMDGILCTEVLEHVPKPIEALLEFARLLKAGGKLLLSVPAACRIHRVPTHYYGGFGPDFFERSFPECGLHLDELVPVGKWSEFLAQELGRMPSVVRDNTRLPRPLATALSLAIWPTFRIIIPSAFLAFSTLDTSDDLPLGWIAYATKL